MKAQNSPKQSKKTGIIIGVLLLALVVGIGGAFFYLRSRESGYMQQADEALAAANFHEAINLYNQAMSIQPDMVRQHDDAALRGRALFHLGDENYAAALDDLTAVLPLFPDQPELKLARAKASLALADDDSAIADLNDYLAALPHDVDGLLLRAAAYRAAGDETAAAADFDAVLAEDTALVQPHLERLNRLAQAKEVQTIISEANEIIAIDETLPEPYMQRGLAYLHLRQDSNALTDFTQAATLAPELAEPLAYQAIIFALQEKDDEADRLALSALALDEQNELALAAQGSAQAGLGVEDAGFAALNTAVSQATEQNYPLILYLRGLTYRRSEQLNAAQSDAELLLAENPDWNWALILRGDIHLAQGELPQAQFAYQQAVDAAPDFGPAYAARAAGFLADGDFAAARADLSTARSHLPDYVPAMLLQAEAALQEGLTDDALAFLDEALAIDSEQTAVYATRAAVNTQLNNWEMARDDFNRV